MKILKILRSISFYNMKHYSHMPKIKGLRIFLNSLSNLCYFTRPIFYFNQDNEDSVTAHFFINIKSNIALYSSMMHM